MRTKMGRPKTHPRRVLLAVDDGLLERIDKWRRTQVGILPPRATTMRYLMELGLKAATPKPKAKPRR